MHSASEVFPISICTVITIELFYPYLRVNHLFWYLLEATYVTALWSYFLLDKFALLIFLMIRPLRILPLPYAETPPVC